MKSKTSLTKAELMQVVRTYQETLFKIKGYCDNPDYNADDYDVSDY